MSEPKYVIGMGACTITGGMFSTDSCYSPKLEAVIDAITKLRKKISREIYEDRIRPQRSNWFFTTNHKFHSSRSIYTGNYDQGFLYQPALLLLHKYVLKYFSNTKVQSPYELVNQTVFLCTKSNQSS
ncbi:hypothetical protein M9H77_28188 [Catharanthus roseus]|uniref:Uncharacterized protein n=1 Tax=Catharanthus roseus TaxID=4058 RepID=A0ACC0AEU1_CATRO|nr:hypothetical protein M9H77_28188 [Catharanthus roseus]